MGIDVRFHKRNLLLFSDKATDAPLNHNSPVFNKQLLDEAERDIKTYHILAPLSG